MRKYLLTAATALAITLGGCSTTQVTDFLKSVQATTAQACMFVPTIDTILAVAAALGFSPAAVAAGAINTVAAAICSQVPPSTSAQYKQLYRQGGPAKTIGTVIGIPINGWRV